MKAKQIVLSGLFVSFGITLPMIFHQLHMGGPIFLPMHIPVLLCGLFLGPVEGLMVGILTPILSSLLTGMPVFFPMLPIMVLELGAYGFAAGYIFKISSGKVLVSMLTSMILGRIAAGIAVFFLVAFFGVDKMNPILYVKGSIITGLPGIAVQIVSIPIIVRLLNKVTNTNYIQMRRA